MPTRATLNSRQLCSRAEGRRASGGFTLIELVLAMTVFMLLLVTFSQAVDGIRDESEDITLAGVLNVDTHDSLFQLANDIRNSTFTTNGAYPWVSTPTQLSKVGWNTGTPNVSEVSDETNRVIVFLLPLDADGDDRPDVNAAGEVIWNPAEFAYVLVPDPSGRNRLERWIDGALESVISRCVETFTVDSNVRRFLFLLREEFNDFADRLDRKARIWTLDVPVCLDSSDHVVDLLVLDLGHRKQQYEEHQE